MEAFSPKNDTAEVLTTEADLRGVTLTFINGYVSLSSSCPRNYGKDFDAILEFGGDQLVLDDFNTLYPFWFSRTKGDSAAGGCRARHLMKWNCQLLATGRSKPWRGQPSSPEVTIVNSYLFPGKTSPQLSSTILCWTVPSLNTTWLPSYVDKFLLLASACSIMDAETMANRLTITLVMWADRKQLFIGPQKSSVTLLTLDMHTCYISNVE